MGTSPKTLGRFASEIEEKQLEWLVPDYFGRGELVQWDGAAGVAKSFLICQMGADLTRGTMPAASGSRAWQKSNIHQSKWSVRDDLAANLEDIERVARLSAIRVVAFGAQPIEHDQSWLEACLEAFEQPSDCGADERLWCLGINKTGQPLHPMARGKMRVPDDTPLAVWR